MGTLRIPKKKIATDVKVIDPKPIWVVTMKTESGNEIKRYMGSEEAERYMQAGHQVKLITTAGELRQY